MFLLVLLFQLIINEGNDFFTYYVYEKNIKENPSKFRKKLKCLDGCCGTHIVSILSIHGIKCIVPTQTPFLANNK